MSEPQNKQAVTEDDVIEYVLNFLYKDLNENEKHLEKDILAPTKIEFTNNQIEHLRELIISTNFVKNSVGFGKNGYMYLTAFGITQLKTHGTYRNFLKATHGLEHNTVINHQPAPQNTNNGVANDTHPHFNDDMAH